MEDMNDINDMGKASYEDQRDIMVQMLRNIQDEIKGGKSNPQHIYVLAGVLVGLADMIFDPLIQEEKAERAIKIMDEEDPFWR